MMEWILWIVVAVMLALLGYTVFWTSLSLHRKGQPVVDLLFDALHTKVRRSANSDIAKSRDRSGKST